MDIQLEGRLALVTASTAGIGKEIAAALADEGALVIVNGRSTASVEAAVAELSARIPSARFDGLVADNGTPEGVAQTAEAYPAVDILVNNLGGLVGASGVWPRE